jgi:hypothetical protein
MDRLPRLLTLVPQAWPVRAEIVKAINTLAGRVEEEQQLRRHAELAAIRRDCELLAEGIREFRRALHKAGFNRDEPRVPAGNPDGGQWTSDGGNNTSDDISVLSDAAPNNSWVLGAQYATNDSPIFGQNQSPPLAKPPNVPQEQPETRQAIHAFVKGRRLLGG